MARYRLSFTLLAALIAAGCAVAPPSTLPSAPRTKILRVSAGFPQAPRALREVTIEPWTLDDVGFVEFRLVKLGGNDQRTDDDTVVMAEPFSWETLQAQPEGIGFANLSAYTRYRLEARAYADRDESGTVTQGDLVISRVDSATAWQRTITVSNDDELDIDAHLALQLAPREVNQYTSADLDNLAVESGKCFTVVQGVVSTLAGRGWNSSDGASGLEASLYGAGTVAYGDGAVFVAFPDQGVIKRIDAADRTVTTVAGVTWDQQSVTGDQATARLHSPAGMVYGEFDGQGYLFVADPGANKIYRIKVGHPTDADYVEYVDFSIHKPQALALTPDGTLYATSRRNGNGDPNSGKVYKIETPAGAVRIVSALATGLNEPFGIVPFKGNLLVGTHATGPGNLKEIALSNGAVTTFNQRADVDAIVQPTYLAVDHADRVWVSDVEEDVDKNVNTDDHRMMIKAIDPAVINDGNVSNDGDFIKTWITGSATGEAEDGLAADAAFPLATYFAAVSYDPTPVGLALDPTGFVYFADPFADDGDHAVRTLK